MSCHFYEYVNNKYLLHSITIEFQLHTQRTKNTQQTEIKYIYPLISTSHQQKSFLYIALVYQ